MRASFLTWLSILLVAPALATGCLSADQVELVVVSTDPATDGSDQVPEQPQTIVRVPVRDLLDGRVELLIDDAGNRMVAAAMARPIDLCERGFLAGRWHKVEEGRGHFVGRWAETSCNLDL